MNNTKREVGKELINLLTEDEIRRTYERADKRGHISRKIGNGCELITLHAKPDGYVQVSLIGISLKSERAKELFNGGKHLRKVLWHQLAWRYHNDFQPIPYDGIGQTQIGHLCGQPSCGAKAHLQIVNRKLNESQKKCAYVYTKDSQGDPIFFLYCLHKPQCHPANRVAVELRVVEDKMLERELRHHTIKDEDEEVEVVEEQV